MAATVSTPRCPTCHSAYWRYRADFPPRGYCSVKCWMNRGRRQKKVKLESPVAVLDAYREHRFEVHATQNLTDWIDCEVCERYEERYAVSMYL